MPSQPDLSVDTQTCLSSTAVGRAVTMEIPRSHTTDDLDRSRNIVRAVRTWSLGTPRPGRQRVATVSVTCFLLQSINDAKWLKIGNLRPTAASPAHRGRCSHPLLASVSSAFRNLPGTGVLGGAGAPAQDCGTPKKPVEVQWTGPWRAAMLAWFPWECGLGRLRIRALLSDPKSFPTFAN